MKKSILVLIFVLCIFLTFGCSQKKEAEEVVETPEPTEEVINVIDFATVVPKPTETPVPENKEEEQEEKTVTGEKANSENYEKKLVKFSMGDGADLEYVITDIIGEWNNTTVIPNEGDGVVNYYIIPKKKAKKIDDSVACITVYSDEMVIREIDCTVFLDGYEKNKEYIDKVYAFFKDEMPVEVIANFDKDAWKILNETGELDFDKIYKEAEKVKEGEKKEYKHGSFSLEISADNISPYFSLIFYSD